MTLPRPAHPAPWAEAITIADKSGNLFMIVDLFLDPRVTEIDRVALAELFSRKVLRDVRPSHMRNAMIRAEYRNLRAEGVSSPDAIAEVADRFNLLEEAVEPIIRRSQRLMRWSPPETTPARKTPKRSA